MIDIEHAKLLGTILLRLVFILLVTIGILLISRFILKHVLWPAIKKTKSSEKIFRIVENSLLNIIVLQGTQAAIEIFSIYVSDYAWLINNFFFVLYVCLVTYVVLSFLSVVADWYLSSAPLTDLEEIDYRAVRLIQYISQLIFVFLAITIVLHRFALTQTLFRETLAAVGVGGIILSLAAQNTLTDIITGIAISIDRPFRNGDRIFIEKLATWGDVTEMSWRSTRILTTDNREVVIPNSVIGKELITNYSMPDRIFRIETFVVVSYSSDIEHVRNLIIEVLEHEAKIMHNKPLEVYVFRFTEFGVEFMVRCWIESYVEKEVSENLLNTIIYEALKNANIGMPRYNVIINSSDQKNRSTISRQDNDLRN